MSTDRKPPPGDAGGVVALLDRLVGADPAGCDRQGLDALVADIAGGRAWLDSIEVAAVARARQLAAAGTGDPVETVLSGGSRRSQRNAARAAERADVCEQMPAVNAALSGGSVTGEHIDAIATAAASLSDKQRVEFAGQAADLAAYAATSSVDEFERECRRRARNVAAEPGSSRNERNRKSRNVREWNDRETGMGKTMISLDAETHDRMWAALNAAVAAAKAAKQDDGVTFAQLQADANMVPIVLGGTGVPLDVGRSKRLATREQLLALRAMYSTCAMPGCNRPFDHCQIHHIDEWRRDQGPANLDRLVPLCSGDHHLVHEGRWRLELEPDRTLTVTRPDGTTAFRGRTDNRAKPAA